MNSPSMQPQSEISTSRHEPALKCPAGLTYRVAPVPLSRAANSLNSPRRSAVTSPALQHIAKIQESDEPCSSISLVGGIEVGGNYISGQRDTGCCLLIRHRTCSSHRSFHAVHSLIEHVYKSQDTQHRDRPLTNCCVLGWRGQ